MKTVKTVKSICILLLVAGGGLAGASQESLRTDINPALLYYQAFLLAPEPMSQADDDHLGTKEGHRWKLPERYGKILAGYDNQFKLVRQAARSTAPCDWGVDLSAGPETLLPYLARAKAVAVAAMTRVRWELQHGQQAEARDDLLAAFVLGRNDSRDGTLISALCQTAIECMTYWALAEHFGQFSPETLQQLVDGIDAAPARGTVARSVLLDHSVTRNWLIGRIQEIQKANSGDDAKTMAAVGELFDWMVEPQQDTARVTVGSSAQTNVWERLAQAAGGTSQGVIELVRGLDPVVQKLAVIARLPYGDFEKESKGFRGEIEGSSNPLVPLLVPGGERARRREFKTQVYEAMVRAAVEYKLRGDSGFRGVTDPCGQGPFVLRRFIFHGVDRGFQLTSAIDASDSNSLVFVEKEGDPFLVGGPHVGQAYE